MKPSVLVADDDRAIREALARALELDGYAVVPATDGVEALAAVAGAAVELIVLDVMMPGVDGLQVCRVLRGQGDRTPILMLTARVETADRIAGLDAGADDYLVKPFEVDELLARLRALLRRSRPEPGRAAVLTAGDLRLDPMARRVWRGGAEIELSRTEFDLLELLVHNAGIVLDRTTIHIRIWGYDFGPESKNLAVRARQGRAGDPAGLLRHHPGRHPHRLAPACRPAPRSGPVDRRLRAARPAARRHPGRARLGERRGRQGRPGHRHLGHAAAGAAGGHLEPAVDAVARPGLEAPAQARPPDTRAGRAAPVPRRQPGLRLVVPRGGRSAAGSAGAPGRAVDRRPPEGGRSC